MAYHRKTAILTANRAFGLTNSRLVLASQLRDGGFRVVLATNCEGVDTQALGGDQLRFHHIDFNRTGASIQDVRSISQLARLFAEERPELVHNFNAKAVVASTIASRMTLGRNSVVANTVTGLGHAYITGSPARLPMAASLEWVGRMSDAVVFQNPDDMQRVGRRWPSGRKHLILSAGVDIDRFRPSLQRESRAPKTVLMVGRITRQKGVLEYISAAQELGDYLGARYLLAGERDALHPDAIGDEEFADRLRNSPVEYLGFSQEIHHLMRSVDLVVVPSYREGFSRAILEAYASGIPVVATDVPGCREAIRPGLTGWLVPSGDGEALAGAIRMFLDLPDEVRLGMSHRVRRLALDQFSLGAVAEQHMALYERLGVLL